MDFLSRVSLGRRGGSGRYDPVPLLSVAFSVMSFVRASGQPGGSSESNKTLVVGLRSSVPLEVVSFIVFSSASGDLS